MEWYQAVVLGLVQAVSEFLPISSSGHLILVPHLLNWPDQGLDFDIASNTGTLLAVLIYFRRDVGALLHGGWSSLRRGHIADNPEAYLLWALAFATIPVGLAGLYFKPLIESLGRTPLLIATTAVVFGLLLGAADWFGRRRLAMPLLSWRDAILIGCAQALALVPGTSRSGITMTMALMLGFTRETAARFSFLLAIPVGILAAGLDAIELSHKTVTAHDWQMLAIGLVVSGCAGLAVIHGLLTWLRRQGLMVFVFYRLTLGAAIFTLLA
ncbi:MAG: undecaprenyl-diphosphate phosphatase [Magnetococcales bacterium]|nr:undecaprenyl-diphosphate phosphatase [Magnetococcales bacterium]